MDGIIVIDKEKNVTSRDVVNDLVHIFHTKKVGHTGTLDPLATGVLVCTIGKYTKLGEVFTSTYKEYIAEFKLGIKTDTYDIEGTIIEENSINLTIDEIKDAIMSFKGKYMQEVPIYSSVKVNGKKLYDYARNNIEVELPKREVDIKELEVLSIKDNIIEIKCLVSKGTYIRSLINDIGNKLGCGAIMTNLRRTKQGIFNIEDAYKIEDVKNSNYKFININDAIEYKKVEVDDYLFNRIKNGSILENRYNTDTVAFTKDNQLVAIYKVYDKDMSKIKPWKML